MTEPTLRELCERVVKAWSDYRSKTVRSSRTCDAYHDACYTLGKRLHIDASMWNDLTAKTILSALDAEREAGCARGFVDAMSEVTFGASALPPADAEKVEQIETPPSDPNREHGGSEREKI